MSYDSLYKWFLLGLFPFVSLSHPAWGLDTLETPPPWGPSASVSPTPSTSPVVIPLPTPSETPSVSPSPSPLPSVSPSITPTAPPAKLELVYQFDKQLNEGHQTIVKVGLVNVEQLAADQFPLKGMIHFEELGYDLNKHQREIPFQLDQTGRIGIPVVFQSPGKKTLKIQLNYKAIVSRHVGLYVMPFKATVFPLAVDTRYLEKKPQNWHIWVNLHHSMVPHQQQRQYYLITYKGTIVQKLLTSSAGTGHLTPQGKFKLGIKLEKPKSTRYESVMPFWTTINISGLDYGNHGLEGDSYLYYLGLPASHGCLRLSNKIIHTNGQAQNIGGAKWVYSHVPVGTAVHIFEKPSPAFTFEDYRAWLRK